MQNTSDSETGGYSSLEAKRPRATKRSQIIRDVTLMFIALVQLLFVTGVAVVLTSSTFQEAKDLIPFAGSVLHSVQRELASFSNITAELQSIVAGLSNINTVAGYFAGHLQAFTDLFEFVDAIKTCVNTTGVCPNI